jgi:DNA-binding GntR family transcriptional regulator
VTGGLGDLPSLGVSTLGDRLTEVLEEAILAGTLSPGQRLSADELARQFAVSRIPVREALRSLEAEGWIELRPRQGAYVRRRTERELADLFEVREVTEPQAAGLAARRRTAEQLAALDVLVEEGRRAAGAGDVAATARLNARFHTLVAGCTGNGVLAEIVESLSKRTRFAIAQVSPGRARESVEEHARLVEALRAADPDRAEDEARAHVGSTRRTVAGS